MAPILCGAIAQVTNLTWGFRAVIGLSILAFGKLSFEILYIICMYIPICIIADGRYSIFFSVIYNKVFLAAGWLYSRHVYLRSLEIVKLSDADEKENGVDAGTPGSVRTSRYPLPIQYIHTFLA